MDGFRGFCLFLKSLTILIIYVSQSIIHAASVPEKPIMKPMNESGAYIFYDI